MNVKRFLKKQAQSDRRAVMEADGGEMLRSLGVEYPAPQPKSALKRWLAGAVGAALSVTLVVCLLVFYPFQKKIDYIEADFESRPATLAELNGEMHDFVFEVEESLYSTRITRTSDSASGDVLYYKISIENSDTLTNMDLVAVCNDRFEYKDWGFTTSPEPKALPSYTILYEYEQVPNPQFGLDFLSYTAEIDGKKDIIYIVKYEELPLEPEGTFFETVQKIIRPKSSSAVSLVS